MIFYLRAVQNSHKRVAVDFNGNPLFYIQGRWGRLEDQLIAYSPAYKEICRAKQVLLSLFPKFELKDKNGLLAYLTKYPAIKNSYFRLSPLAWIILCRKEGSHFQFFKKHQLIADIQKNPTDPNNYSIQLKQEEWAALTALIACLLDHYSSEQSIQKKTHQLPPLASFSSSSHPSLRLNKE